MGVFCTDRLTGARLGLPNRVWVLLGQSLAALGAGRLDEAFVPDGYVPSWLGWDWGALLFEGLGELIFVCRPAAGRSAALRPLATYRRGSPAALAWARHGEQLSVYDLPLAPVLLGYAQFCTAGTGHRTTTLRPTASGSATSEVAARVLQVRSGLFPAPRRPTRTGSPRERRTA